MSRFDISLARILEHEGGFVDHPEDPGGVTNMGITIDTLSRWRGRQVRPEDVEFLTRDEAAEIYKKVYWQAAPCSSIPIGLDFLVFDAAVNHGVTRSIALLQEIVATPVDGKFGPASLAAVDLYLDSHGPIALIREYAARRMLFYGRLSTFRTFGRGWSRRLMASFQAALEDAAVLARAA
jgi:lysozyme family protein